MRRYDHLERLGHREVDSILIGKVHIFAKLDGTCSSVWFEDEVRCGSRNRTLSLDNDNQGFCAWVKGDSAEAESLRLFVTMLPYLIVYGEWLVPHTLRTYRDEAWRRFWIFDVFDTHKGRYLSWEEYSKMMEGDDLIEPLCTIQDPSEEQVQVQVEMNTYLVQDGAGPGEGVVVKNYLWTNQHGRQPWAKVVRTAFKEDANRKFGFPEKTGTFQVEAAIVEEFVTAHLVGKTRAKIVVAIADNEGLVLALDANDIVRMKHSASPFPKGEVDYITVRSVEETYRHKVIPQLLGHVFHELVSEECWAFIKKHKNPVINFKLLQSRCVMRTKELAQDLF